MSDTPGADAPDADVHAPSSTSSLPASAVVLRRERAGGFGIGVAVGTAVAASSIIAAVSIVALAFSSSSSSSSSSSATTTVDAASNEAPVGGTDLDTVRAAVVAAQAQQASSLAAWRALEHRAVVAERGERLRQLGRIVARARDVRRAAGLVGPELRGPFPRNELTDLDVLGLGADRWLLQRDGAIVVGPAGAAVPPALATTGRDEDPLELAVDDVTLVRRCLPNEGYCIVDVVRATAPPPVVDVAPIAAALATSTPAVNVAAADSTSTSSTPTTSTTSTASTPWWAIVVAVIVAVVGVVSARQLWSVSTALRLRAWRLRSPGATTSTSPTTLAELRELDAAIDDLQRRFAADGDDVRARHRRERVQELASTLDDARVRGGVPRVDGDDDDDAALAGLVFSVNALLDTLDARATRLKLVLDEVDPALKVLTPLAQRLLRLARIPELPTQIADELTSLGTAVGQRARKTSTALPTIVDDVARFVPASSDVVSRAAALRDLPGDDALRLGIKAANDANNGEGDTVQRDSTPPIAASESPSTPPRPST